MAPLKHRHRPGVLAIPAVLIVLLALVFAAATARAQAADPLPSWNEGAVKQSIRDFVARATEEGGPDFVPVPQRIATFDNDGTLWAEQPVYFQAAFIHDRIVAMSDQHPEWKTQQPYKAVLENDRAALAAIGEQGLADLVAATHGGMTTQEFADVVADWLKTARHPRFDVPYTELAYAPMLELLDYLRANGFKTFIVSGGGIDFMRVFTERLYGIPPEQVVGSSGVTTFKLLPDGAPVLEKSGKIAFIDDGPGKPVGIDRFIGRRPVFAFGNSDGDLQMLQWTTGGDRLRFAGLVHHTDAVREWAYDRDSPVGRLDKALDEAAAKGWAVTDMKRDWKRVFAFEK
jgi:phosphoglycolate phosphatase-like HAD superfamily hydrolase